MVPLHAMSSEIPKSLEHNQIVPLETGDHRGVLTTGACPEQKNLALATVTNYHENTGKSQIQQQELGAVTGSGVHGQYSKERPTGWTLVHLWVYP